MQNQHLELFAENDMLEKIKTMSDKIGEEFDKDFHGKRIIKEIRTEFPKQYCDPYYHGIGILIENAKGETKFEDVYSLTNWHLNEVFK